MKLQHRMVNSICIISLDGNMIHGRVTVVEDYIKSIHEDNSVTGVVFNLGKVQSIDSTGLGVLIFSSKKLKEGQVSLALCHLQADVREIIAIAQLESLLNIFTTEADAITGVS